ncbi:MAG: ferrochelatase [Deltaproteobacteria bacterium]|nr:ferrochelatase [Deltaproteobacteria bacterium]
MARVGLMLVNLGTPAAPRTPEVRTYLREFLSDPRVLDMPALGRALLLYGVILPFRPSKSAEAYRKVWTDRGSPVLFHGVDLAKKVQAALGPDIQVELAMRYQQPSIGEALDRFRASRTDRIAVLPLFPQNSSAAWGSAAEKVLLEGGKRWNVPTIQLVPPFYDHPAFLDALARTARPALATFRPEHVLLSFHGLPERQVRKSDESEGHDHCLAAATCCDVIGPGNRHCYRAHCFATARGLAARLDLPAERHEVSFQSRLGRTPWIQPHTDERVRALAQSGVKRLAVLCPAFVADCLETLEEIGIRARDDFRAHGGEELLLVPALNSRDAWVDALIQVVRDGIHWPM